MSPRPSQLRATLARIAARWSGDRRGNIAVISAFMIVLVLFGLGIAIDYSLAATRQDKVNGIADSAALYAVTPNMLTLNSTTVQTQTQAMMAAQMNALGNVGYSLGNLNIAITDVATGTTVSRTVVVAYRATSNNIFSGVLGLQNLPISGTSTAKSALAPKIDFYLLLDTSPSMGIAATTSGISTMVAHTSSQGGCAFACHESNPAADGLGNPGGEDNYALARNLGVTLRIDLVNQAVQNLMSSAVTTQQLNNTTYRAGIYTMDYSVNTLYGLSANLSAAATAASNIQQLQVYQNTWLTASNANNDEDSNLDQALSTLNTAMPNPGGGTNNTGDTPQEVLFIVSDGVVDEPISGNRIVAPINTMASWCASIKARGTRIAFLYLTYNPLPTNAFYQQNVAWFQSSIATDAQNCASPGLYFQVNTGGDISAAMTTLFQKIVATARLTQ